MTSGRGLYFSSHPFLGHRWFSSIVSCFALLNTPAEFAGQGLNAAGHLLSFSSLAVSLIAWLHPGDGSFSWDLVLLYKSSDQQQIAVSLEGRAEWG